jgi:XTP/dITP diphosphohydrolase
VKILIATKNRGKAEEIKEMLGGLSEAGVEFVSLAEMDAERGVREAASVGVADDFVEDGESFSENALGKARFFFEKTKAFDGVGIPTVADDSGIFVEALADELGVKTRRWGAGEKAGDEEWLDHFMQRMKNEKNRKAKFVCAAAIVLPGAKGVDGYASPVEKIFIDETCGIISELIEAPVKVGIPLSSVFKPEKCDKVFAALSIEEKNRLSHRGKAFSLLRSYLLECLQSCLNN